MLKFKNYINEILMVAISLNEKWRAQKGKILKFKAGCSGQI